MMTIGLPHSAWRDGTRLRRRPRLSIRAILRAAYRRHSRDKLTWAAARRYLG